MSFSCGVDKMAGGGVSWMQQCCSLTIPPPGVCSTATQQWCKTCSRTLWLFHHPSCSITKFILYRLCWFGLCPCHENLNSVKREEICICKKWSSNETVCRHCFSCPWQRSRKAEIVSNSVFFDNQAYITQTLLIWPLPRPWIVQSEKKFAFERNGVRIKKVCLNCFSCQCAWGPRKGEMACNSVF